MDELIAKARTTNDLDVRKERTSQFQEKWDELEPECHPRLPALCLRAQRFAYGLRPGRLRQPGPAVLRRPEVAHLTRPIFLLTDYGWRDPFVGQLKAVIAGIALAPQSMT